MAKHIVNVRDFDILLLHLNHENKLPQLRQAFQINHRIKWIKRRTQVEYQPDLKVYLIDDTVEFDDDNPYVGVYICLSAKAEFKIAPIGRDVIEDDVFACIREICKQMDKYVKENKAKFSFSGFSVYPDFASELFDEVRKFFYQSQGKA